MISGTLRDIDLGRRRVRLIDRQGTDARALPLLLVHGASGNGRDPALAFSSRLTRHRAVFVDRPGQGGSTRLGRADAAPDVQAEVLAEVLERLDIARAVVIGHSWGGSVVAALAVARPDLVAGLAFLAPATHPWPGGVDATYRIATFPFVGRLFCGLVAPLVGPFLVERAIRSVFAPDAVPRDYGAAIEARLLLRPGAFRANAEDVADLHGHVTRLSPRYREIAVPTLVVTGDRDPIVLREIHSAGLARDISGARLVVLPGIGHMPHHAATERVAEEMEALIARVEAGGDGFTPVDAGLAEPVSSRVEDQSPAE